MSQREASSVNKVADFATYALPEPEKFAFFCDHICDVYTGIQPEPFKDIGFEAGFRAYAFDGGVFAVMNTTGGHTAFRTGKTRATRPDDSIFLNFCDYSDYRLTQGGEDLRVRASTPVLIDNDEDFAFVSPRDARFTLHSLRIDRAALGPDLDSWRITRANRALSGSRIGMLLTLQARLMCDAFRDGHLVTGASMVSPLTSLIRECLGAGLDADDIPVKVDIDAIKAVAARFSADPDFGIQALATILRVSPRTIQSRFAEVGETFSGWLLDHRLEKAHYALIGLRSGHKTVSTIAFECGFRDLPYFYRAFRRKYAAAPGTFVGH